jgi:glucosamine--fructose-6-phosphate aminotransferase (isomerizing)
METPQMTDFATRLNSLTAEPSRDTADDPARLARVERTRVELFGQGAAIRATLAAAEAPLAEIAARLAGRTIERIVVAGCGDSWFAGLAMRHALERLTGRPAEGVQALDYAAYGAAVAGPGTLVVGISSGGNTPAVMAALTAAAAGGAFTIGVSNTPGSPITTDFDAALLVEATRRGWPTQSTNATMALLVALGAAIAPESPVCPALRAELATLPDIVDRLCVALDAPLRATAAVWAPADLVLFTGLGPNFAAAAIGAAKLRELSPVHGFALPLEEYHHYRSQKAGDPIVVVATDPASVERALDTALVAEHVGGPLLAILAAPAPEIERRAAAVVRLPAVSPALAPMLSILPLHHLAHHFAVARAGLGLGAPRTGSAR